MRVHKTYGTLEEGKKLTDKYLLTDYNKLVEAVVETLWKNLPSDKFEELIQQSEYNPGVKETFEELKKLGFKIAIITCGPNQLIEKIKKDNIYFDYAFSNHIEISDGIIKGNFKGTVAEGRHHKVKLLTRICDELNITKNEVIAVADGKTDLEMIEFVGMGIAFRSTNEHIKKAATHIIQGDNLKSILEFIR
ncbi:HAD-IB family phosphatase [Candidatus Woesearchaeota archaeon]|jgi:phosphoserine phosphatase|nr:HAD-IB family phosphatase [Candidatus Woesearchaeota archaeon]